MVNNPVRILKFYSTYGRKVMIPKEISAADLSKLLNVRFSDLVETAKVMDFSVTSNHTIIPDDISSLIAIEHNVSIEELEDEVKGEEDSVLSEEEYNKLPLRPPIVTIMGHVDHGKTTLLDSLRKTSVAKSEAGGITQHIGAFSLEIEKGKSITFIDTPGHSAFTSMRARGAKITDMVVLVVARDDGVMPQTIEAINHAKAANCPIIVAITKADLVKRDLDFIFRQLLEHEIHVENLGGDVQCVQVSAVKNIGLYDLEQAILTQSELMNLRAPKEGFSARCRVIESTMKKGVGRSASIVVQKGILHTGSTLVFDNGKSSCKIRKIIDQNGKMIPSIGPSMPCEIIGAFSDLPEAGDEGAEVEMKECKRIMDSYKCLLAKRKTIESFAEKAIAENKALNSVEALREKVNSCKSKLKSLRRDVNTTFYDRYERITKKLEKELKMRMTKAKDDTETTTSFPEINLVLKCDVHGSLEAVSKVLSELSSKNEKDQFRINILHSGVGPITRSDIDLLICSNKSFKKKADGVSRKSALIGFNIRNMGKELRDLLDKDEISFINQSIIYKLVDEVKGIVTGVLKPEIIHQVIGDADVLQVIPVNGGKSIVAGCRVMNGSICKNINSEDTFTQIVRNGEKIFEGEIASLRNFKDNVDKVMKGMECGIIISFPGIKKGDHIQQIKISKKFVSITEIK